MHRHLAEQVLGPCGRTVLLQHRQGLSVHEQSFTAHDCSVTEAPLLLCKCVGSPSQGGVWVLGMIKGGAADRAGVRQGDEILRVNGQEIGPLSPFKVAGLMQGADSDASDDSDTFVDLEVTACTSPVLCRVHLSGRYLQSAAQGLCRRKHRNGAMLCAVW